MATKHNRFIFIKRYFAKLPLPVKLLALIAALGVLAPLLCNDLPLYTKYKGHHLFPAFHFRELNSNQAEDFYAIHRLYQADWKTLNADFICFAPITYRNTNYDYLNAGYVSPFEKQLFKNQDGEITEMPLRYRHWLGTGKKGEDIFAVVVYGARYTFLIAFAAISIASIVGFLLGTLAGYFGNYYFKTTYLNIAGFLAGIIPAWFYAFDLRWFQLRDALNNSALSGLAHLFFSIFLFMGIAALFTLLADWLSELFSLKRKLFVPVDRIVSLMIELLVSIPSLILIISITSVMRPSIITIIIVIAFTAWPFIARQVRSEMLKLRNFSYIDSARAMGYSPVYIIVNHVLPNISASVAAVLVYTIAAAVLLESSLSFLGIAMPHGIITWGSVLAQTKDNFNAWWISLFTGGMIFFALYCLNRTANLLLNKASPR